MIEIKLFFEMTYSKKINQKVYHMTKHTQKNVEHFFVRKIAIIY